VGIYLTFEIKHGVLEIDRKELERERERSEFTVGYR
jgi:hypothetical protein